MSVGSVEVLQAMREGATTLSAMQHRFRCSREHLLTRLTYLARMGFVTKIGNHRKRMGDRRWRVVDRSPRNRSRTRSARLEQAVWKALGSEPKTIMNLVKFGCWPAVKRALYDLEAEGAAKRAAPPTVRRTWVRGDRMPSCMTTRAALGNRESLVKFITDHPGTTMRAIRRRWSHATILGAVRVGELLETKSGNATALWPVTHRPEPSPGSPIERAGDILAELGTGKRSTLQLVKDPEDADLIALLRRNGWLEGTSVQVIGYGLTMPHSGAVEALAALDALVTALGPMTLDQLAESRPMLLRRLQHQATLDVAKQRQLIVPTTI